MSTLGDHWQTGDINLSVLFARKTLECLAQRASKGGQEYVGGLKVHVLFMLSYFSVFSLFLHGFFLAFV